VAHGAALALVKANIETSGPILRRAGFGAYGREPVYEVPLLTARARRFLLLSD
jgi:hypothetical protein